MSSNHTTGVRLLIIGTATILYVVDAPRSSASQHTCDLNHFFVPMVRGYCQWKNIAFKMVLFLDNAQEHAKFLVGRHPDGNVTFLPPNTTSKIQSLDPELIANVKLIFYSVT